MFCEKLEEVRELMRGKSWLRRESFRLLNEGLKCEV